MVASGELLPDIAASSLRVIVGFTAAALVGVSVGWTCGMSRTVRLLFEPANSFLRYIPPTALVALWIIIFGLGEQFKAAVVFFSIVFFVIQMVIDATSDIDQVYVDMGITNGFSKLELFWRIILPASLPRVWDVLRVNFSAAWTFLVVAELIGVGRGIGHLLGTSQRFLRLDDLYATIVTFGILGVIWDRCFEWGSHRLFRWHYVALNQQ
jgi:NitT/TauT family transport system permease protein